MAHKKSARRFSILESLRFGFYTIIEHFAFYIGLMLSYMGILLGAFFITLVFVCLPFYKQMIELIRILDAAGLSRTELVKNVVKQLGQPFIWTLVLGFLVIYCVYRLLNLGMTKIALEFYDSDESSIKSLFAPWRLIIIDMVASFIYSFGFLFGVGLLIFPGIYFMLTFAFYHQIIVDKEMGIIDAFKESARITHGAKWQLFALLLLLMFIRWIAFSFFGVTLLIVMPLVSLVDVYVYRRLKETRK